MKNTESYTTLIFLDFDGVVVLENKPKLTFVKELFDNVLTLCNLLNAKIVLSTSWRFYHTIEDWNRLYFNSLVIDITPDTVNENIVSNIDIDLYTRGLEIKQWIVDNKYTGKYLIIADCNEILPEQEPYFIKCKFKEGFTTKQLNYALTL